jgi:hypothetical protein
MQFSDGKDTVQKEEEEQHEVQEEEEEEETAGKMTRATGELKKTRERRRAWGATGRSQRTTRGRAAGWTRWEQR